MYNLRFPEILIATLITTASLATNANNTTDEMTPIKWQEEHNNLKAFCQQSSQLPEKSIFPDSRNEAKSIREDFCKRKIENLSELNSRIANLLMDLERLFPDSTIPVDIYSSEIDAVGSGGKLSPLKVFDRASLAIAINSLGRIQITGEELENCNNAARNYDSNSSCKDALENFSTIYQLAYGTLAQPEAWEVASYLERLEQRWSDYFNDSKSQTLWELALNKSIFRSAPGDYGFAEPPEWQLVVMHPNFVIENIADAVDGEQTKESIMIEAIGIDWWQQDKWYLPSGGSLIATYSDRAGIDDWGYGVSLNFDSSFTLGVADHGGELGTFVTVDLLKLLQDKSNTIRSYRDSADF